MMANDKDVVVDSTGGVDKASNSRVSSLHHHIRS